MNLKKISVWAEKYWPSCLLLVGLVVFALIMILARGQSIWFDEGYSILLAKSKVSELISLTAVDAHPPFYYLLLKFWGEIFGYSEFALRSLSALLASGVAVGALAIVKKLFGTKIVIFVVPFVVFAPFILRYGYEIRMYALASLIGVVATYALICAKQSNDKKWWAVYAVLVALGMYTLYMTIAIWLTHFIWLVWSSLKNKQPIKTWRWPLAYGGAIILFLPYLPTFFHQMANSALPGIGSAITLTTLVNVLSLTWLYIPEWSLGGWISIGLVILIALLVRPLILGYRVIKRQKMYPYFVLITMLAIVPLIIFAILSLPPREPIFVPRYMAHVAIWIYLTVGILLASSLLESKKKLIKVVYILVVISLIIGVISLAYRGNFVLERMQNPMTRELASFIQDKYGCGDQVTVVANDPYTFIDSNFYLTECNFRFVAEKEVAPVGGYAMLNGSKARLVASNDIDSKYLVFLHWGEPSIKIDERYKKVEDKVFDKHHIDIYQLK